MKLLGIDISNLVIRHSANPYSGAVDPAGRSVAGPVGAISQILRLVEGEKPTHLLIARDGPRDQGFRREISSSYKAHRPDADDDLIHQFRISYQAIEVLGWPLLAEEGHEADDLLASAAKGFEGKTVIVSGDKDLLACASKTTRVSLLRPGGVLECDVKEATEVFGVRPERIQDYKALVGDPSDGIKGVEGIGPKRALALLEEYDNLEGILKALDDGEELRGVTAAICKKMIDGRESAEVSYQLAQLVDDLQIDFDFLQIPEMPTDASHGDRLEELGLSDLRRLLPGAEKKKSRPMDLGATFENLLPD